MKTNVSSGTDSDELKMSSLTKLFKIRLPACVRPEKRLVRSFATNTRACACADFFRSGPPLPPVEPKVSDSTCPTKDAVPRPI